MKSSEFAECLDNSADLLKVANATASAASLHQLSSIFRLAPTKKVSDIVAKLDAIEIAGASFLQTKVDSVATIVSALSQLAVAMSARSQDDFKLVHALLKKSARTSLDDWIIRASDTLRATTEAKPKRTKSGPKPLNSDLVERYFRMLETSLGDDPGFRSNFAKLEADPEMRSAEVSALAKRFSSASVKARPAALKKIFSRHQALMINRAAAAATAGRIAG